MGNCMHLIVCFVGCFMVGISELIESSMKVIILSFGLYAAFQGAALFVASEIRDKLNQIKLDGPR